MPTRGGQWSTSGLLSQQRRQGFCACAGGPVEGENGGWRLSRDVSEASRELGDKSISFVDFAARLIATLSKLFRPVLLIKQLKLCHKDFLI